jgi:AAA15 family ATPase/GTPase
MVLEIRLSNFFSIRDEITLDLQAGKIRSKGIKALVQNTFEHNGQKVLKTVALYGANASGKSNIIKAIRFCCAMVFESQNHNDNAIFNFIPFKFSGYQNKPSTFFIRFIMNQILYEYSYSLTRDQILTEDLFYYPKGRKALVFNRNERKKGEKKDKYSFGSVIKRPLDVVENTSVKTLFISRASQLDRDIAKEVFNFFANEFLLGFPLFDKMSRIEELYKENRDLLLKALQIADSDIINIKMSKEEVMVKSLNAQFPQNAVTISDQKQLQLKFTTYHKEESEVPFDLLTEESEGTIRLFAMLLTIIDIVKKNKVLILDELETSLHNDIVEFIIALFHASHSAQLIFSTHNTNLINLRKLRKDQIYFVNKKKDASTDLYSLFDYKDFRDTMDAEKGYLQGRFDAIPYIDTSSATLKMLIYGKV